MNRPLLFRAWDGEKMHYWNSVDHNATDQIHETPYPKLYYLPMSWLVGDSNDWKWMQNTGLADKDGISIYEGDIITKYVKDDGATPKTFTVVWNEKHVGFDLSNPSTAGKHWYEVKGNIFEHPNLLKDHLIK